MFAKQMMVEENENEIENMEEEIKEKDVIISELR